MNQRREFSGLSSKNTWWLLTVTYYKVRSSVILSPSLPAFKENILPTAEKSSSPSSLFRTEVFSTKPAKTTCLSHTHNIFKIFSKHNSFTHSRGESLSWHRQSHEVHVYIRRIKREKLNLEIFYPSRVVVVGVLYAEYM